MASNPSIITILLEEIQLMVYALKKSNITRCPIGIIFCEGGKTHIYFDTETLFEKNITRIDVTCLK